MCGEKGTDGRRVASKTNSSRFRVRAIIIGFSVLAFISTLVAASYQGSWRAGAEAGRRAGSLSAMPVPDQLPVYGGEAETVTASLVQTIDTSLFSPASPDPAGIAYNPTLDRLIVVDSEVDETTGAGYHGVNMWQITRNGAVTDSGTTLVWGGITNDEPTGADYDPVTNTLFVSTDQPSATCRIYLVQPGADGRFGTADDGLRTINTNPIIGTSSPDTEDPVFDPATGHLFFLNGQTTPVNPQVFRIDPVNGIFGDGDDVATHFDIGNGAIDAEGLTIDEARDTLLVGVLNSPSSNKKIYEFTKGGTLVRIIDASGIAGLRYLSGMTMAPASNGSGRWNIWIVDRAVDNDSVPTENDGKLFEISVPAGGNTPPVVTSVAAGPTDPKTNDVLTATVNARDDDGNPLTFAYQWLRNGSAIIGETGSTLDLSVPGNGDKGDIISVRATASDGTASSTPRTSAAITILNSAPVLNLSDLSYPEGAAISVSAAATDADNDSLTYSATGLPAGLSIDSATGLITGTIPAGARTGSPYAAVVTARDPDSTRTAPIKQIQAITNNITPSGVNSVTLAYTYAPTPGNLLIAEGRFGTGRTPTMPAGWQLAVANTLSSSPRAVVFYKIAGAAEPQSVTLTASGNVSSMSLTLFEYAGLKSEQASVFDTGAANNLASASSISSGATPVTTQADELLIAGLHLGGSRAFGNTWTNGFRYLTSANYHEFAYKVVSATGSFETTESWGGTATSASMTLASFKGAGPLTIPGAVVTDDFVWIVTPPAVSLSVSSDNGSEAAGTQITVTANSSAAVVGDQTVSLGVSGMNVTAGDYTLSGQTITIPNGAVIGTATFGIVDDGLVEGTETATLTISDPSSGIVLGSPTSRTVTIADNDLPPTTTIDSYPPDPSNDSSPTFTFSGTDPFAAGNFDAPLSFECRLGTDAFVPCTSPVTYVGLADGVYTFEVRSIDNAGNIDPTPAFHNWRIHTELPSITYAPLASTPSVDDIPLIVTATDDLGIDWVSVKYSVNGGAFASSPCSGSGPYNCAIPGNDVGSAVAYYVEACDLAGNLTTDTGPTSPNLYSVGAAGVPEGTYAHIALSNGSWLGGNVLVIEDLALGGVISTGAHTLSIGCPATITPADDEGKYVNGGLEKIFCASPETFKFPIGENGYAPVEVIVTDLGANPSSLTIRSFDAGLTGFDPLESLTRNWQIDETGELTATLRFFYPAVDAVGNEANYRVWRREGNGFDTDMCLAPCVDAVNHVIGPVAGLTSFSRWTGAGPLVPTAANVSIAGRVLTSAGQGIRNATVTIAGGGLTEPITVVTGSFGYYKFEGLEAGGVYVVSVSSKRFVFAVPSRVVGAADDVTDLDFVANGPPE
ncbi:MAG: carboxypeptidase regulatory-like domain-containing protein [Acidobacteria bacterium]|nr:carboxypeptidase regulatory-like domain-containing protein [Acidobacteriota bacterium]